MRWMIGAAIAAWPVLLAVPALAQSAAGPPPPAATAPATPAPDPAPAVPATGALAGGSSADAGSGNVRVRTVVIFGDDSCPKASNPDEIIVCARRPEEERYRIPKTLRDEEKAKIAREDNVGENRAALVSGRTAPAGIGSCSTVGAGGSIGCTPGLDILRGAKTVVEGVQTATEPDD